MHAVVGIMVPSAPCLSIQRFGLVIEDEIKDTASAGTLFEVLSDLELDSMLEKSSEFATTREVGWFMLADAEAVGVDFGDLFPRSPPKRWELEQMCFTSYLLMSKFVTAFRPRNLIAAIS